MAEGRFRALSHEEMNEEQRKIADAIAHGPRQHPLRGPFISLLRAPILCDLVQQIGAYVRYKSSLPEPLREFIVLITARHWNQNYVFHSHRGIAIKLGLSTAICDAVANGKRPEGMSPGETAIYEFCTEMLTTRQVSDAKFEAVKKLFGERGVTETVVTMGHYCTISFTLHADRHPIPPDAIPLPVIKN